jgi:hypothetical protein
MRRVEANPSPHSPSLMPRISSKQKQRDVELFLELLYERKSLECADILKIRSSDSEAAVKSTMNSQ